MLPTNLPPTLADSAFALGDEFAWPLDLASEAATWLAANGYAVLGTELWVVNNSEVRSLPVGESGLPECHGNSVDRRTGEEWQAFVSRSGAETLTHLQAFEPAEIRDSGELYFNITWVDEGEFESLVRRK